MNRHQEAQQGNIPSEVVRECEATNVINVNRQTVTMSTDHLPEKQKALVRWVYTVARDNKWSWQELIDFAGYSSTVWYRIFHDRYRDAKTGDRVNLGNVCKHLAKLKAEFAQPAYEPADHRFVETSVWDRVDWICRKAFARKKLGFVYGESHIGKTASVLEYQRRNNHGMTAYWELPPSGGVQLMTRYFARALHVTSNTSFDKMLDNICTAVDRDMLVIVDQIHRVFYSYQKGSVMRCLDVLMHVHDRTGCPMVFVGTNIFRDNLREGPFKQYLKQFRRRGLYELQLPDAAPKADLNKIAAAYALPPPTGEAEKVVHAIARNDGLAMFFTRLDDAAELAANKKQQLTWEHFLRAVTIVERMAAPSRR